LQRGVETLLALPLSNFFSTLTVAFSLALISGFILLISNVEGTLHDMGSSLSITAYVESSATDEQISNLIVALENNEVVKNVDFTSKAKALREFRDALGEEGTLLGRIEGENPLPASLDVQLENQSKELNSKVVEQLEASQIIREIISGNDVVEKVSGLISAVKVVGYGGGLFLFGVVLFLILNTVKLVIYSQRQEIEVMQLVGATESTVRIPFLVAGAIQGLFGAIVGVVVLRLLFGTLRFSLEGSALFGATLPLPEFFGLSSILFILLAGTLLGIVSSALAVGRHLDV
jgi:cell division transport system permease protein